MAIPPTHGLEGALFEGGVEVGHRRRRVVHALLATAVLLVLFLVVLEEEGVGFAFDLQS